MMYKCSVCLVIGGDDDHDVVSFERTTANPLLGLDLCLRRMLEKASLLSMPLKPSSFELQLLGWVDPIINKDAADYAIRMQSLADGSERWPVAPTATVEKQL